MDIADIYIDRRYPFTQRNLLRPVAHDQGHSWIVTYEGPEGAVGGTPTIEVRKSDGRVVAAIHTQ